METALDHCDCRFTNFYRRFINGFSKLRSSITSLLSNWAKSLSWNSEANTTFNQLKKAFSTAPTLVHPNPDLPFVVEVEASTNGVGAVLSLRQGSGAEDIPPPSVDPPEENIYPVNIILDSRRWGGLLEYLVDWERFGQEERSWVACDDILDPSLLHDFHNVHPNRPAPRGRGLSRPLRPSGAGRGEGVLSQSQQHRQHQTSTLHQLVPSHQSTDHRHLSPIFTDHHPAPFNSSHCSSPLSGLVVPSKNTYLTPYLHDTYQNDLSSVICFLHPSSVICLDLHFRTCNRY
ncbi:hypothetical protein PO909_002153 [Leuciscus waleckii]